MPGKSKGKKKKGGKKTSTPEDEETLRIQEERKRLIEKASKLKKEIEQEESLINEFNSQVSQIRHYWSCQKENLGVAKQTLMSKENEVYDKERGKIHETHRLTLDDYKQKIKHLLFEHQNEITVSYKESEKDLRALHQESFSQDIQLLKNDIHDLRQQLHEDVSFKHFIHNLQNDHNNNQLASLKKQYARKSAETIAYSEHIIKAIKDSMEVQRNKIISQIESEKDDQIERLIESNRDELSKLREEHNKKTQQNLNLIKDLKNKLIKSQKLERMNEKSMNLILSQNKEITVPLKNIQDENLDLSQELETYKKEKQELLETKEEFNTIQAKLQDLEWKHEVLYQRFLSASSEQKEYQSKVQDTLFQAQQKSHLKNTILEEKIKSLKNTYDSKLALSNHTSNNPMKENQKAINRNILNEKDTVIQALENKLKQIKKTDQSLEGKFNKKLNQIIT